MPLDKATALASAATSQSTLPYVIQIGCKSSNVDTRINFVDVALMATCRVHMNLIIDGPLRVHMAIQLVRNQLVPLTQLSLRTYKPEVRREKYTSIDSINNELK